jgi:hypothetical protein
MAIKSIRPTITAIVLALLLAMPVVEDKVEKLVKETNSFSSGSAPEDSDKVTTETRGLSGWKRKEDSCRYAEQAAKRKAESTCNKKKGIHLNFINAQCFDCKQSAYYHEWYCSSRVIAQCSSIQKLTHPRPSTNYVAYYRVAMETLIPKQTIHALKMRTPWLVRIIEKQIKRPAVLGAKAGIIW